MTFGHPRIFDFPYDSVQHRHFVLDEIRHLMRPASPRPQKYIAEQAARWRAAILRDAPLLKGFFAEEPNRRTKVLHWCEKTLKRARAEKRSKVIGAPSRVC